MTCLQHLSNVQPWVALTLHKVPTALQAFSCLDWSQTTTQIVEVQHFLTKNRNVDLVMIAGVPLKHRISGVRQMTYSPWGYHAGGHGSPVIMGRPSSASTPNSRLIEKRLGMVDKKRMLLPSPASFGLQSKPNAAGMVAPPSTSEVSRPTSAAISRSQTSMSNYKPW